MSATFITRDKILAAAQRIIDQNRPLLSEAQERFSADSKAWFAAHPGHKCRQVEYDYGCDRFRKTLDKAERIKRLAELTESTVLLSEEEALFLFGLSQES